MDLLFKAAHNKLPNLIKKELGDEHFSKYFMSIHLSEHVLLAASVSLCSYLLIFKIPIVSRNTKIMCITKQRELHKKWSFPFKISSVNVTKSAVSFGFGHIYWKNP